MSQYASTVVIQVSNSRLWETLGNISVKGFNLAKLEKVGERCYRNRKDMSYTEEDLTDIVQQRISTSIQSTILHFIWAKGFV